jgi:hypothetical protein
MEAAGYLKRIHDVDNMQNLILSGKSDQHKSHRGSGPGGSDRQSLGPYDLSFAVGLVSQAYQEISRVFVIQLAPR